MSSKLLQLKKIHIDKNGVDMFTKVLPNEKLEICRVIAGMIKLFT